MTMHTMKTVNEGNIATNMFLNLPNCKYGGKKYETYVTVKKGESKPDSDILIDYNFELNSVVYTKLVEHSVILAGEVDCCLREDTSHYVQLKTEGAVYKEKDLKWWL